MIRALRRIWNRLLGSLLGRHRESDLAEELDAHIRLMAEENVRRGLPADEAHRRARLEFGSVESTKESYRDQRGLPFLDTTMQDLRYALCGIRKNPGFATVAILSLAIGIGANTAIFSLVNSVLLQPLAYKDPQRVFWVREVTTVGRTLVNPVHAREWAKECPSVEQVALMRSNRADIAGGGEPATVFSADVPHNLFTLLGVEPILGRTFFAEEEQEGNDRAVILSEPLWRSRFNADRSLVGKSILIDRQNYEVAGIIPAWIRLPYSRRLHDAPRMPGSARDSSCTSAFRDRLPQHPTCRAPSPGLSRRKWLSDADCGPHESVDFQEVALWPRRRPHPPIALRR
ncbi:MAG: ABC transporter permease [Acidobacteria bacterium]|nr:ABC transporter permease [Acidobacteriota bacterium]